jgi:quercetin dioxygenase-like cupin family protein
MQISFPHTIATKREKITFLGLTLVDGVEVLEALTEVQPGGGPPMHTHFVQDEGFTVLSGFMAYETPEGVQYAYPGETVWIKAGVPHRFWNPGKDLLRMKGFVTPANNFVYFLTRIYESINQNGGGKPGLFDGAYLLDRYKAEFAINEIPAPVQRFVFPVARFVGRLFGKDRKFSDAPPPLAA